MREHVKLKPIAAPAPLATETQIPPPHPTVPPHRCSDNRGPVSSQYQRHPQGNQHRQRHTHRHSQQAPSPHPERRPPVHAVVGRPLRVCQPAPAPWSLEAERVTSEPGQRGPGGNSLGQRGSAETPSHDWLLPPSIVPACASHPGRLEHRLCRPAHDPTFKPAGSMHLPTQPTPARSTFIVHPSPAASPLAAAP